MAVIAPLPSNEAQRLEWLRQCNILDTLPELAFDEAAQLAAQLCRVPIASINFVDHDRQWSKAAVGHDTKQDSREVSFCAHAILHSDLFIVPDACADERFADNPLVTGDPHIRFYAGAPLITSEGFGLGALCVIDRIPRQMTPEQRIVLQMLAHQIVGRIELMRHVALQNKLMEERTRLLGELGQIAEYQQTFLRDVLFSVTGGRLRLCQEVDELPLVTTHPDEWVRLSEPSEMRELRCRTEEAADGSEFTQARRQDLITAVGEAAMNAIVHGGGGRGAVTRFGTTVQVWVEDRGSGIEMNQLPRATLERGYTTAGTLGFGMKIMLESVDRVYLLTNAGGTTVVMEQDRVSTLPAWLTGQG